MLTKEQREAIDMDIRLMVMTIRKLHMKMQPMEQLQVQEVAVMFLKELRKVDIKFDGPSENGSCEYNSNRTNLDAAINILR